MKEKSRQPATGHRKGTFLSAPIPLFIRTLLYGSCLFALGTGCENPAKPPSSQTAAVPLDLFPEKVAIKYAKGFSLEYHGNFKVVNILNYFGDQVDTLRYVLVPAGTPTPTHFPDAQIVSIPVCQMVGMSSMHVALADFAESAQVLIGLGDLKYVSSTTVRKYIAAGKVKEVGNGGEMNEELLIAMQPDLVMVTGSPEAKFSRYSTLIGAGIPVMLNSEWLETTPLGRAEWVKLMAALLNKEALINKKFASIERQYHHLAALSKKAIRKPRIITGLPFKGAWTVPDGDSYMARFLKDAAATYPWGQVQGKGNLHLDFERVAPQALQADFWLNLGYVDTKADILDRDVRYKDFLPFKQGGIFNNNKRINDLGANDYWESGNVNPHLILADLIRILHPELLPKHELVYYKQLQ